MIIQFFLIFQTIIYGCHGQVPIRICYIDKPFETGNTCGDFNDICVKKDDLQCNNFQAACKQCPPTNYTVSMLLHLKNQIDLYNQKIASLKGQSDDCQKKMNILRDAINTSTILSTIIICAIQILIVIKYKKIVKYFSSRRKHKILVPLTWDVEENNKLLTEKEIINDLKDNEKRIQKIDKITNEKVASYKLRFQIINQFDETELFVSKFDNVIKLKKSICDRNMNMNDYKRMIMKYKGVTLDNNQYLLSYIDSTNIPIFCEFDNNIDVDAMIVIKLKRENIYPEMLQIQKHQQIKDLKIIISKLNKTNNDLIFYKSTQLDDDKTIDDYKIEENDWIIALNKFEEMPNLSIKSIFTAKETISIEFSKSETVSDIINKSIPKIQHKMATNHFAVFLNKKLLQNDKLIYEYNIDSKSLVEFCYFKSSNEIHGRVLTTDYGHIIMYRAKNKITERPVLMKAYEKKYMDINNDKDLSKVLREDLQLFQITKFHPRFIQLFDIYLGTDVVYIELENQEKGLMKSYLSSQENEEIPIYEISKWAYQILGGLKYLHSHGVILKDMNPMNIWIDGNLDIKLPSFNMTQFLNHLYDDDNNKSKYGILTYVAPEILEGKDYEASVDVWSLGVIMIDIITRGQLYSGFKESEIVRKIKKSHTIKYKKTEINQPEYLFKFIDCCVKGDPKERATIDKLMKMEFIEKYLLFNEFS